MRATQTAPVLSFRCKLKDLRAYLQQVRRTVPTTFTNI